MKTFIIRAKLKDNKRIYRDIEISESVKLYDLALAINNAFGFQFDHLFGFGNKPSFYSSDIQYELVTEEYLDSIKSTLSQKEHGNVEKIKVNEVSFFKKPKDRMSFLFDFGDNWEFELELRSFGEWADKNRKHQVVKIQGEAPEQYPVYE